MEPGRLPVVLRQLREAAGLTQVELAARAGIRSDTISRIECGSSRPTWAVVVKLAAALRVPPLRFAMTEEE